MKAAKPSKIEEIRIKGSIPRVFVFFLQTAHVVEKYCESELYYKAGLSMSKLGALWVLEANGGSLMPSKIALLTLLENQTITALVDRLSKEGLVRVERKANSDRRQVKVILTDKGRQALKRGQQVYAKLMKKVMANLNENAADSLEQLLKIIRLNAAEKLYPIYK